MKNNTVRHNLLSDGSFRFFSVGFRFINVAVVVAAAIVLSFASAGFVLFAFAAVVEFAVVLVPAPPFPDKNFFFSLSFAAAVVEAVVFDCDCFDCFALSDFRFGDAANIYNIIK